jgi:hypothetical protein
MSYQKDEMLTSYCIEPMSLDVVQSSLDRARDREKYQNSPIRHLVPAVAAITLARNVQSG